MKTQSELVVNDILPSLRAAVSKELIDNYSMNQSEVAEKLGVSQPAVSQYLRRIRGAKRLLDNQKVDAEVKSLCTRIYAGEVGEQRLHSELWNICRVAMDIEHCPLCMQNGNGK